jgi:hypothetical protein
VTKDEVKEWSTWEGCDRLDERAAVQACLDFVALQIRERRLLVQRKMSGEVTYQIFEVSGRVHAEYMEKTSQLDWGCGLALRRRTDTYP